MSEPPHKMLLFLFKAGGRNLMLWSWHALLLLLLTLLLVRFDRTRSPATRCHLWLAGLIAVAGMPLWTEIARAFPLYGDARISVDLVLPHSIAPGARAAATTHTNSAAETSFAVAYAVEPWAAVFVAWLAGFLFSLVNMIRGCWKLYCLKRNSSPTEEDFGPLPSGLQVNSSEQAVSPILIGVFRPIIILPAGMLDWTTAEERTAVICHELSHFRRGDHIASVFQAFLNAVFFFHPMVRYASRQLSWEREFACDSEVLAAGHAAPAYADTILKVAEKAITQHPNVQPAFSPTRQILERRIDMIMNHQCRFRPSRVRNALTLAKAATALVVMLYLLAPRVPLAAQSQSQSPSPQAAPSVNPAPPTAADIAPAVSVEARAIPPATAPSTASAAGTAAAPIATPAQLGFPAGRFYGNVFDPSGAIVPGVKVRMSNPQALISAENVSGEKGEFEFSGLPSGPYSLEVTLPGFGNLRSDVTLVPGQDLHQNAVLSLGSIADRVEVSARAGSPPQPGSALPVRASGAGLRLRVGGNVVAPRLISRLDPVYPQNLRDAGIEGTVVLESVIGTDGVPIGLHALGAQARPDLTKAAIEAVSQWRYEPTQLNGAPAEVVNNVTVVFKLVQ